MKTTENITVLFADIAQSTQLYETLGDTKAEKLIGYCLSLLMKATSTLGGTVIKTYGDGILCTFTRTRQGLDAAMMMQQFLESTPNPEELYVSSLPNLYIGIHTGPVIFKDNDVFGDTVNLASRLSALAKQRQILITQEVADDARGVDPERIKYIGKSRIKGKAERVKIHEYIWEEQDVTVLVNRSTDDMTESGHTLELRHNDTVIKLDFTRDMATIGRQPYNDIVVDHKLVSRLHAQIEYRKGRFLISDRSSNGTYVRFSDGKALTLKQKEIALTGRGVIALGTKETDTPHVIHFKRLD